MNVSKHVLTVGLAALAGGVAPNLFADGRSNDSNHWRDQAKTVRTFNLPNSTQAPLWPPAEIVDKNGDFVVVGTLLRKAMDGSVAPGIGGAIVSANTTPPLNEAGVEDFSNLLGASYDIIRELDLSPGSKDREIELFSSSYGPSKGNFGGASRIPMAGKSRYNLNALPDPCPEIFPSESQKYTYTRDSYPLRAAPILGFQGDQVAYDVNTGAQYDPMAGSGPGCGAGCSGENNVDSRPHGKITLGQWLDGTATVEIRLKDPNPAGEFRAAKFTVSLAKAIPDAVYTVWLARASVASNQGQPEYRQPTPGGMPNVILTDSHGKGSLTFDVENPFPAPAADPQQTRVVGMAIDFHSDYQNWGACFARLGAGVDIHAQWVSFADGTMDFTDLVTVPKQ